MGWLLVILRLSDLHGVANELVFWARQSLRLNLLSNILLPSDHVTAYERASYLAFLFTEVQLTRFSNLFGC